MGDQQEAMTPAQQHVVYKLEHELVAPCCYSQVVAAHMSGEAFKMKDEIVQMVLAGRTEQQIIDGYKIRYGKVILASPDGLAGQIAVALPGIVFLTGLAFIVVLLRRWLAGYQQSVAERGIGVGPAAPPDLLKRIRAEWES